jgi:hypothetical protein
VSRTGVIQENLDFANPTRITKPLNEPWSATVRFPKAQYALSAINVFDDIQIFRNGHLLFWGVIWDISLEGKTNECVASCGDYVSIFRRLNLDKPKGNNLTNGSFETGDTTGWFNNTPGIVTTVTTEHRARGTYSLKLQNSGLWTDRSWQQTLSFPASVDRRNFFISAWFRVTSTVTDLAAAIGHRGLYMEVRDLATNEFIRNDYVPLDKTYEPDVWHRTPDLRHTINPGVGRTINVRLYAPSVTIYWDEVAVSRNEPRVNTYAGPGANEDDITNIFAQAVNAIQSVANGKTNLHVGNSGALTGIREAQSIPRYEHMPFDQFASDYQERSNGVDTAVMVTPTTKSHRVFPDPGMGDDLSGSIDLIWGDTLADYNCTKSGSDAATRVTVQADGDGADREEAEDADTSFANGLTLQDVRPARPESSLTSLDRQATGVLRGLKRPVRKWDLFVKDKDLIPDIRVGDTVHLTIDDGWMQANLDVRVINWDLDCENDVLMLTAHEPTNT